MKKNETLSMKHLARNSSIARIFPVRNNETVYNEESIYQLKSHVLNYKYEPKCVSQVMEWGLEWVK